MPIQENYRLLLEKVRQCALSAGRNPASVKLVAVSKFHPVESIREAVQAGAIDFGESRVQEAKEKIPFFPEPINWHFIGTLQKNKVKHIAGLFHLIHSVDSIELAEELQKQAERHNVTFNILLQANISREEVKHGFEVKEVLDAAKEISAFPRIRLKGVMGMAPWLEEGEQARPYFQELKLVSNRINQAGIEAPEISMGMSGDFEVAIQEGSTLVRIGTAIFGERH